MHKGPGATLAQGLGEESGFKSSLEEGQGGSQRNPEEWEMCQRAGAGTEKEPPSGGLDLHSMPLMKLTVIHKISSNDTVNALFYCSLLF